DMEWEIITKRTRKAFGIRRKEKDTDSTQGAAVLTLFVPPPPLQQPSPHPNDPTSNSKAEGTREGGNKNGSSFSCLGFFCFVLLPMQNSPELDEEGYSIRPEEPGYILWFWLSVPTKGKHFYSSSESEEEEEAHKKFNIKIKPLQAKDVLRSAATVDELKASIGNIALSPSPVVSAPGLPRPSPPVPHGRSVLSPHSKKAGEDPAALAPLFGPPLESAFEEAKLEAALDQPEIWGSVQPINTNVESPKLPRPFPTGTPPPLPPKNIPATPPRTGSPLPPAIGDQAAAAEPKRDKLPSINDLDSIFGPVPSPKSAAATAEDKWVNFSDQSPENAPPELSPRDKAGSPAGSPASAPAEPPRPLPSPLQLEDAPKKLPEQQPHVKDDSAEPVASPKDFGPGQRGTPPPPPPPTYRAVVSSPGPGASTGSASGTRWVPPRLPLHPLCPLLSPLSPPVPSVPAAGAPPPLPPPSLAASPCPSLPAAPSPPGSPPSLVFSPQPSGKAATLMTCSVTHTVSFSLPLLNLSHPASTPGHTENEQPSLVWFDRGKFYLTFEGSSRGPSPLTMGAQDTLPVAAAFTETVNAYFKGADPNKCIVKITGEMVLSFPAGITRHFANNPAPAVLTFRVLNFNRLEHVLPNPQLLCCDSVQSDSNSKEFWVNMPNLMTHLKKVSEQKPQATYYNVDMLKYQVSAQGIQSTPLNLAVSWRCDPASTDLRIDYKYNTEAMTTPVALNNVQFLVPVDGGVTKLQAVLPPAVWNAEQQRILWKIPDISQKSENGGNPANMHVIISGSFRQARTRKYLADN
uniref:MHD domain-containing protein n=1 Tax=Zonotrichia albicollis TaxID=44394 RepID=A0A8D2MLH1_ZONAL